MSVHGYFTHYLSHHINFINYYNQSNNILTCPNVNTEFIDCNSPMVAAYLKEKNKLISKIEEIIES